jgi:MFS-type transporter involved in bile tolerance (Atg22 family)
MEHLLRCPAHFLGGRVLTTDPINALIVFMSICATDEVGFTHTQLPLASILFAVPAEWPGTCCASLRSPSSCCTGWTTGRGSGHQS